MSEKTVPQATLDAWTQQIILRSQSIDPAPATDQEKAVFERLRHEIETIQTTAPAPTPTEPPPTRIGTDELRKWIDQIKGGEPISPKPRTEEERQLLARVKADVERIQAEGGSIELPFDD